MRKFLLFSLAAVLFVSCMPDSYASGPVFWRVNTRAEIEKGDAKGVAIADNGALTLAPQFTEVFDTKQAYVWSAVADARGNVYLGTGHEGRVFKVDSTGKGALLYKTSELDVMALAVDATGNVYAGTAPDGKVYRITPGGEAKVFFEPKTKYIWSLAFDAQGRLLVGTGDKGVIYRVNADGTGAPLVTTTQTNITALKVAADGTIYAGTDPGGLVLRIGADGKAFTLYDAAQREVRELALGSKGEVYALALSESAGSGASNAAPAASGGGGSQIISSDEGVTVTLSDVQVIDSPGAASMASSSSGAGSSNQAKAAVYRVDGNGGADVVWESKDAAAFGLALDPNQTALVGTGQKGRIYLVPPGRKALMGAQLPEAQISRLWLTGNVVYAATSNLGKLYRAAEAGTSGTYTSTVRESATGAAWGRLSWLGEGEIELQTRSGNTATPDDTWGAWSTALTNAEGETITSSPARFLQWRATLKRTAANKPVPRLREVTVSYLPRNVAPKLNSLNALPVGVSLQAIPQPQDNSGAEAAGLDPATVGGMPAIPPRRTFQRGAISLQWQAEDRNSDTLEYTVAYRNAMGGEFYPLKQNLRESYYTIDANALPDGKYVFKVTASDGLSNPGTVALSDELETEAVEIDNTPPAVVGAAPKQQGNQVEAAFQVTDATSLVRRAEYQLDGGAWKAIFPVDGIADAKREDFTVKITLPDARSHVIAFRAFDANGNVGSAVATVKGQ